MPSPDGSRIAYLLAVPRDPFKEDDGPSWQELHVVEVAGGKDTTFVSRESLAQPQWTPDGRGVSFLAKRGDDKTRSVYLIPVAGGEARRVVSHESDIRSYDWSPDGTRVVFLATPKALKDVEELRKKGFNQEVSREELRNTKVHIVQVVSTEASRVLDLPGSATRALWSPDGKRLAVVLTPTPLVDDDLMRQRVHVVDAESGKVEENLENP